MSQNRVEVRCFLCHKWISYANGYKSIDKTICTTSRKKMKDILNYLGRCTKNILPSVPPRQSLCLVCSHQLEEYDTAMVAALRKQRKLAELVESACLYVDVNVIEECESIENDDFDDINISDSEIAATVREALMDCGEKLKPKQVKADDVQPAIQCSFCAMKFRSKVRLNKHVTFAHKKFCCDRCTYSHRNEDYVKLHMNVHEGRSENQCRYCDKEYCSKLSLIRHMECHFDTKKYQCDKCGLCFSQTTVLYNHKLQHEAEEQPLQCEICAQIFKTKRTFRHHMITHQADRPRYSCEFCSKTFTEKYTLKVHKRSHATECSDQSGVCDIEKDPLKCTANVESETTKETRLPCIICQYSFATRDQLNKHMEREHDVILKTLNLTDYSPYENPANDTKKPCHICGQMFSTQANLDSHFEQIHAMDL